MPKPLIQLKKTFIVDSTTQDQPLVDLFGKTYEVFLDTIKMYSSQPLQWHENSWKNFHLLEYYPTVISRVSAAANSILVNFIPVISTSQKEVKFDGGHEFEVLQFEYKDATRYKLQVTYYTGDLVLLNIYDNKLLLSRNEEASGYYKPFFISLSGNIDIGKYKENEGK